VPAGRSPGRGGRRPPGAHHFGALGRVLPGPPAGGHVQSASGQLVEVDDGEAGVGGRVSRGRRRHLGGGLAQKATAANLPCPALWLAQGSARQAEGAVAERGVVHVGRQLKKAEGGRVGETGGAAHPGRGVVLLVRAGRLRGAGRRRRGCGLLRRGARGWRWCSFRGRSCPRSRSHPARQGCGHHPGGPVVVVEGARHVAT